MEDVTSGKPGIWDERLADESHRDLVEHLPGCACMAGGRGPSWPHI